MGRYFSRFVIFILFYRQLRLVLEQFTKILFYRIDETDESLFQKKFHERDSL